MVAQTCCKLVCNNRSVTSCIGVNILQRAPDSELLQVALGFVLQRVIRSVTRCFVTDLLQIAVEPILQRVTLLLQAVV